MWKLVILLIRKRPDPEPESMSIEHVRMTDTVMHTKDVRINATMSPVCWSDWSVRCSLRSSIYS